MLESIEKLKSIGLTFNTDTFVVSSVVVVVVVWLYELLC